MPERKCVSNPLKAKVFLTGPQKRLEARMDSGRSLGLTREVG